MTTEPAIEVAGITKSYGDNAVLRGVDLDVPRGTVYALLGPNGAGKTTMVRILSTLIKADAGDGPGRRLRRPPRARRRTAIDRRHRPVLRRSTSSSPGGRTLR